MSSDGVGGVVVVALVAIVPVVVLMLTSFVKMSVVLALLRNALGAPDAPSGLVVMGVSLVLTFFVMAPVAIEMSRAAETPAAPAPGGPGRARPAPGAPAVPARAAAPTAPAGVAAPGAPAAPAGAAAPGAPAGVAAPGAPAGVAAPGAPAGVAAPGAPVGAATLARTGTATAGEAPRAGADAVTGAEGAPLVRIDVEGAMRQLVPAQYRGELDAAARAVEPLRAFLRKHAAERDRETFTEVARRMGRDVAGDEAWVLAPAFLTTELREAFAIAVLIFVPFLVIDLVVGLGLAALGLQLTQPQVVALPLKLLLFVAVDGWRLLIEGLLRGYA